MARGEGWYPNTHYQLGNNFNCDFTLLMPMSSLLISNKKKVLPCNWLPTIITNASFRCIICTKDIFFRQSDICPLSSFIKIRWRGQSSNQNFRIQEIWTRKIDFFTWFRQKQPIHNGIKNRLNTPSHQLLGGSLEVSTKCYVKIQIMRDCIN